MGQSRRDWNWERGSVPPGHWKRDGLRDGDRDREIRMVANFTARCDHCSEVIVEGHETLWHPERKYLLHPWCTIFFDRWAGHDRAGTPSSGLPSDWNKVTVRRAPRHAEPEPAPESAPEPDMPAARPERPAANTAWAEREATKKRRYPRSGQPWSLEEEEQLRDRFAVQADLDALADQHQRTPLGIQARLERLGLIEESTRWSNESSASGSQP